MRIGKRGVQFFVISLVSGLVLWQWPSQAFGELPSYSGNLTNRYTLRTTGGQSDNDLESIASLDIGNPTFDRFSAALEGGGIFDLDGQNSDTTFSSINDTFSDKAVGRLYYAYMDMRHTKPVELLRVGRQHRYEFESLYFDGATIETIPFYGVVLSAFGGVPVHLYETQIGFDPGDWTSGGALQWNPVADVRFRFDYAHIRDDNEGPRAGQGDFEDDLMAASLWADITDKIDAFAQFTTFSDEVRDVQAASTFRLPKQDFSLQVNAYRLLTGYDIRVTDWDAFRFVGTYQPYTEFGLTATKGLGKKFAVDGGVAVRFLDDKQTASTFNHGFERVFVSLSSKNFLTPGLLLSATTDYYHGEDNVLKDNSLGGSFSASYSSKRLVNNRLKLKGGTAFYLYRYNLSAGDESDNVQTYFTSIEGKVTKKMTLKGAYEFEDNDFNNFHSLTTTASWDF